MQQKPAETRAESGSGTARPCGRMVSRWRLGSGALPPFRSIPGTPEIGHGELITLRSVI
ncbi:hypothetical protein D9X30_0847 [Cupriavidus sp. U2]|nr:hypothetical protein D9X30_0847 [Cupriavidus sp. U2]